MINGQSSRPGELPPQALTEPDVNLSVHPAPIVQPLTPTPNAQTGRAGGHEPATAIAMLVACAYGVFCICVAPNARGSYPACAARGEALKNETAHSHEPTRRAPGEPIGQFLPRRDRGDDAAASDAFSAASLWPLARSLRERH